jgi:thiol-disulfide isomerase/thioredoxin
MEKITSEEQYRSLIGGDEYTVIKYETNWCPDCRNLERFIGPIMEENPDKHFYTMDAEQFQDIAEENQVRGVPSLLIYKQGEKIAHLHSKYAKTPDQIREYLKTLVSQV